MARKQAFPMCSVSFLRKAGFGTFTRCQLGEVVPECSGNRSGWKIHAQSEWYLQKVIGYFPDTSLNRPGKAHHAATGGLLETNHVFPFV